MTKITVSAPGKLMLLGEHAVLYNHPCIVTAVGQRMKVTVEPKNEPIFELNAPDVKVKRYQKPVKDLGHGEIPKGAKFVEIAAYNFLNKYPQKGGLKISTKSEFSAEFGFGSSSASTVCTIFALSKLFKIKLTQKAIFDLSYKTVLDIQGKGSGFDVAAAIFGGILYFKTRGKIIKPLKVSSIPLIVGYSGIKANTVTLVDKVSQKAKKYPKIIDNIYEQIEILVNLAKVSIEKGDWQTLGEIMDINQGYLATLGVGSKKLADMIYAARESGAYGAKLSGAGVGDCMIAISTNSKTKSAIEKAGGKVINIKTNVEGVKVEP